ncbi:type II toxin-antitoxin system HicA family toxin [Xanthomonas albilineans]|uniref:type II toxin-antitoxin system HicA family toxin n=1 Tax=Xanthomonas albilineans TaxID=29447 RepID=UPI001E306E44|nr:type II toxin-antitoxin system HicA family toxin [Xanthomonas albilineans]
MPLSCPGGRGGLKWKGALFRWLAAHSQGPRTCPRTSASAATRQHLKHAGWQQVGQIGSHRQFKHPVYPGRVAVAGKPSDDVAPCTLNSILKQAGLKRESPCATPLSSSKPVTTTLLTCRICRGVSR